MNKSLYEDIVFFISDFGSVKKDEISLDTAIGDLGIDGDDASDFIVAFGDKFEVDLSDFIFKDYFIAEGFNPLDIWYVFFNKKNTMRVSLIRYLL